MTTRPLRQSVTALGLIALFALTARAQTTAPPDLHGRLTTVDGVRVLQVWGTPQERGFAHGYLLAEDVLKLLGGYIDVTGEARDSTTWDMQIGAMAGVIAVPPRYAREMQGVVDGVRAKLGDRAKIASLNRIICYEDLLAANVASDTAGLGCSSFSAWGAMTRDGHTLTGRNLDWHTMPSLVGSQIILVQAPLARRDSNGWVSVTWPGFVGCLSGMNSRGLTVAMHDVYVGQPTQEGGFVPRGFLLRKLIESPLPETVLAGALQLLDRERCAVGGNFPVSFPYLPGMKSPPAAILEYAGHVNQRFDFGARVGSPTTAANAGPPFVACTNEFHDDPNRNKCGRFRILLDALNRSSTEGRKLDVNAAWEILASAKQPRSARSRDITYQTIVFEPNEMRMHVAMATNDKSAPDCPRATLDVKALIAAATPSDSTVPAQRSATGN